MPLSAGTFLGPYEIEAPLGAGGMGEVYRARDTRLDRTVAIKMLTPELAGAADARARFEREARAIAALSHPHICAIYDVSPDYLVMELIEGQPLAGPLPLERAMEFASQILSALDTAHRTGITHRDLKPDNILVTRHGIKLVDFGLAKLNTTAAGRAAGPVLTHPPSQFPTGQHTLTGEHIVLGTLCYMSPEQVQGKPADTRSDIFSFGLVLYEMLTGKRAFDGTNPASVMAAVLERDVPSLAGVAPPWLDRLLQRCLAKDPDERWQSAKDVNHALTIVGPMDRVAPRPGTRRGAVAVASLLGFVAAWAVAVPLWLAWSANESQRRPLSFHLAPPAGTEFQFSPSGGGSVIAPDGRSVAFVAVTDGTPRLWIRSLESLTARALPDTDGAKLPFWSPDSSALGFFTSNDLRRIDVSGTAAVVLARSLDPRGATWSPDGTIVFSPNSVGPLYRIAASGGTSAPLTTPPPGESHRWPRFLPDGRTLLFFRQGAETGIYLTTLDRPGDTRRLLDSASDAAYVPGPQRNSPGRLLWVAGDTVMAQPFDPQSGQLTGAAIAVPGTGGVASSVATQRNSVSVSNDGTLLYSSGGSRYQLAWFERDGTPRGTLGAIDQYIGLRLSPDAREVLVTIRDAAANGDLWRIDVASGARSRITADGGGWYGVWSPDSRRLAFTALNRREVLRGANVRGDGEIQELARFDIQAFPSDWSSDGQYLAYTATSRDRSNDVWLLPMTDARTPVPLLQSPFAERHAQFSPDGKWVAFTSNESGRDDVYVQSFPDASTRQIVSSLGGAYPRWGAKGRELFYRAPDGDLMMMPVHVAGSHVELGTPSVLMRLVEAAGVHPYPYDVAADGRILALTPSSGNVQDQTLTVLMNWQAGLEP